MKLSELKCAKVLTRDIKVNRSYRSMKHIPKEWQYLKQNGYCDLPAEYLIDGTTLCHNHANNRVDSRIFYEERKKTGRLAGRLVQYLVTDDGYPNQLYEADHLYQLYGHDTEKLLYLLDKSLDKKPEKKEVN